MTDLLPGLVDLSSRHEADPGDPGQQLKASDGGRPHLSPVILLVRVRNQPIRAAQAG